MAEVYISKSIFPNKAFSAFISCVSKHSLKEEFSSAVLREAPLLPHFREGKACLTLLHLSVLLHPFSFLEGSRLWGFRIFFVTALVCSAVLQRREKVWLHPCTKGAAGWGPEAAPRTKKGGLKTPPSRIKARSWSRAVITADELKRKNAIKKKQKGGGGGDRASVGFAWLDCWLKLILSKATPGNYSGEREHSGCAECRSFRGWFSLNAHNDYKLMKCSWIFCISIC